MEPDRESDAPVEETEAEWWERTQRSREAALKKCWTACEVGDLSQVKEYFEQLGDTNVEILLHRAILKNWVEATRYILEQGANPKTMPLITLGKHCRSLAMFQLLAEFGMDYESGPDNILVYVLDRREILDWLLDQGVDINSGTGESWGRGPSGPCRDNTVAVLNQAARFGDIDLFDHLVARGAKPSQSNAIHRATSSPNAVAMITHLIEKYHLDVNADIGCGGLNQLAPWHDIPTFPLQYAVACSNLPAVEVLLKYGANAADACSGAIKNKNISALKLLLDSGADPSENLGIAILKNYFKGAQLCLECGGDIVKAELYVEEHKNLAHLHHLHDPVSSKMRKFLRERK